MSSDSGLEAWKPWLGLGMLVLAIVAAGSLLELTADAAQSWYVRAYLVLGLALVAGYIALVSLPRRRSERQAREVAKQLEIRDEVIGSAFEELRHGDLVSLLSPIAPLPDSLRKTVEGAARALGSLVQQIQTSSVEVANSAMTVRETSSELASGSTQQAAAVVEITATTEELARTAGQIAVNAAGQADLAARVEAAGTEGAEALEAAVSGVESVQERIEAIASRADTLGSRSREIYQVLDLIRDIAQETHILSLNAAIEAAAAGEHGQRFSVVADEVRRLAERSRESVESVRHLLEEFSSAIRSVVVATEEGSKAASEVLLQARSSSASVDQLRTALTETARTAREISLATQEQRTASDQVVMTLKEVSEVIQRMAEGLKQFTGTAERLNGVALNIQLLTQSFRIESSHSLKHQIVMWTRELRDAIENLEAIDGSMHEILRRCPYLEMAYLVDTEGAMVSFAINGDLVGESRGATAVGVGQSYADRPWFQAVAREGRTAVTPLYESLLTGDRCFTIATAVRDLHGRVTGTLGVDVNVRNWTRI